MKRYRFITDDDRSKFCHRVTEALPNGWKFYGEPKMTFDNKRGCNALWASYSKKFYNKKIPQKKSIYLQYKEEKELPN